MNAIELKDIFVQSVLGILSQFGISHSGTSDIIIKEELSSSMDVTSFIGIIGTVQGNISYSYTQNTAKAIVSSMMMGMIVDSLDSMARSALSELSNMFTGTAITGLSANYSGLDITPPTLIIGEDILYVLGTVETISVDIVTNCGVIELNISLDC
jgi:chemotaxis protein CheX